MGDVMSLASRCGIIAVAVVLVTVASLESAHANKIYCTQYNYSDTEIQRAELDGSSVETIISGWGWAFAVDSVERKIYFDNNSTGAENHLIRRANLNGSNPEVLFDLGGFGPLYIALDRDRGKVYVSTSGFEFCGGLHRLDMYDTGGGIGHEVISTNCILGVAVDSAAQKLYWTEVEPEYRIVRANLDGSGVETVIALDAKPGGLEIDRARGKIYWTLESADHIWRAGLDGSNPEVLVHENANGINGSIGIALDLRSDKLYWAFEDDESRAIRRADLDGSNPETFLDVRPRGQIAIDPVLNGVDVPAVSSRALVVLVLVMLVLSTAVILNRRNVRRSE